MINDTIENQSSPELRAKRVRRLRNMANLSRQGMCENENIKFDTLVGWEVARHGGLTEKGAIKVINRVKTEGVSCTLDWLLHGIGAGPVITSNFIEIQESLTKRTQFLDDEDKQMTEELLFFKQHNLDTIELRVADDGMSPFYNQSDYVAGIKRYQDQLPSLIGLDCIVQPIDGELIFRRVLAGSQENAYHLVCININAKLRDIISSNVLLAYAAPVIWHRRKNPK